VTDANDAVVLVTGGTSGIGRETVRSLADRGATVLVHGRDRMRGERVCKAVRERTPGEATFYPADFADFDQVRNLTAAVADDHDRLDALVNNAGTWQDERRLTDAVGDRSDGSRARVELTIAVNHCAHFLLTHRLFSPSRRCGRTRRDGLFGPAPAGYLRPGRSHRAGRADRA